MENDVKSFVKTYFNTDPVSITFLGGGFYGRVYLANISTAPYRIVVKGYLFDGLCLRERDQLKLLGQHSLLQMPKIYMVHSKNDTIPVDFLAMEFLTGDNAGLIDPSAPIPWDSIGWEIVDNLLSYHAVIHSEGFGDLNGPYCDSWTGWYFPKAEAIFHSAQEMEASGGLDPEIFSIVRLAMENFQRIFDVPVENPCLIHGDYNTWNILLDSAHTHAIAAIDPFNCCWADPEFDLYQLSNANGKQYGLLEKYRSRKKLSDNFEVKNAFYELFTEIMHYHAANVPVQKEQMLREANQLKKQMELYGIS